MQISSNYNSQQRSNQTFTSHFVRSNLLRDSFRTPVGKTNVQEIRQYANAVEGLIKDGKNDVINVVEKNKYIRLDVNNKEYSRIDNNLRKNPVLAFSQIRDSIINFAEKERGIKRVFGYDNLSEKEMTFVKDLNVSQRISKLDPEDEKQAGMIEKIKEEFKNRIFWGTADRLDDLNREIGRPQKTQTLGKGING